LSCFVLIRHGVDLRVPHPDEECAALCGRVLAIVTALRSPRLAQALLVAVALIWLIPDRRIEPVLPEQK